MRRVARLVADKILFGFTVLYSYPAATTASADFPLRLNIVALSGVGEISPGKKALLHYTIAGSTPPPLDHNSFAVSCPLALVVSAFYPVLIHRLAASLHASSPCSVTLAQLCFASFAVISLWWIFTRKSAPMLGSYEKKRPLRTL